MLKGRLIILEGPDCSGKTTLARCFMAHSFCYYHGTHLGAAANATVYYRYHEAMLNDIKMNIDAGMDVVVDRHWPSYLCYNSHGSEGFFETYEAGYGEKFIETINKMGGKYVFCLTDSCIPAHAREQDPDHPYDQEFFKKVYQRYQALYMAMKKRNDVYYYEWPTMGMDDTIEDFVDVVAGGRS
jgi:thymidylate kinase